MSNFVLLVEDNPSDLLITSAHIENNGLVPITATDGYSALEKVEDEEIGLFIIDLQMPKMSGIEVIQRIRRLSAHQKTPIMVTSARKEASDVRVAVQSGANDYIVKPIDAQVFEEKLQRLIGKDVQWKEYEVSEDSPWRAIFVKKPLELLTINEIGVRVWSEVEVPQGESLDLAGEIFGIDAYQSIPTQVKSAESSKEGFELHLSFVGLTDSVRRQIRLACRELWKKQKESD